MEYAMKQKKTPKDWNIAQTTIHRHRRCSNSSHVPMKRLVSPSIWHHPIVASHSQEWWTNGLTASLKMTSVHTWSHHPEKCKKMIKSLPRSTKFSTVRFTSQKEKDTDGWVILTNKWYMKMMCSKSPAIVSSSTSSAYLQVPQEVNSESKLGLKKTSLQLITLFTQRLALILLNHH